jgi:hypothetical protein
MGHTMTKTTLSLLLAFLPASFLGSAACDKSDVIGGPRVDGAADGPGAAVDVPSPAVDAGTGGAAGAGTGGAGAIGGSGGGAGGTGGAAPGPDAGVDARDASPEAMDPKLFPARIMFFYTPLGTVLDSWRPTSTAAGDFTLTGILKPLEAIKDRILVVDGIDNLSRPGVPTTDANGVAMLLTGGVMGGSSLNPVLARNLGSVAFMSLHIGVQSTVSIDFSPGPDSISNSPGTMGQALFFERPDLSAQFSNSDDFVTVGRQQMDLARLAFQYDRTRALTLSWGDINGYTRFSWITGVDKDYRPLAGASAAGADRDHFIAVQTWYAEQFAYLVKSLANTPEGPGSSLLDHTLVVWISETGEASTRTGKNIPVVIAGNLLGRFRNGAYVKVTGSQANLLATIAQIAANVPFGDAAIGNTPITALLK